MLFQSVKIFSLLSDICINKIMPKWEDCQVLDTVAYSIEEQRKVREKEEQAKKDEQVKKMKKSKQTRKRTSIKNTQRQDATLQNIR